MSDFDLISAFQQDADAAAETLLLQYGAMIRYIADGILSDPQETEECVSDVCMRVWNSIASYDASKASFPVWLTAITRNAAISRAKENAKHSHCSLEELSLADHNTPETELLQKERSQALRTAVKQLRERDQQIFYRKYYYLQSTEKIAAEMGLTSRAVEGRLYRLRAILRDALGGDSQ